MSDQQERLKRRILEDIQRQLARKLAELGVEARLEVTHEHASVSREGSARRAELGTLPERWRGLTPPQRHAELAPLAQLLASHHVASARSRRWTTPTGLGLLALLTLGLGAALIQGIVRERDAQARLAAESESVAAGRARSARVCEATRSRVMRGGTAGSADHEGWVVELSLVGKPLANAAAASPFEGILAAKGSGEFELAWQQGPEALQRPGGSIALLERKSADGELHEWRFVLDGTYARAYFEEQGREEWVRVAEELFRRAEASYGALYARCAHQSAHHVGSWFAGRGASAAASALLYYTVVHAETPILTPEYLPEEGDVPSVELLRPLTERTSDFDRTQLAMWSAEERATVGGRDDAVVSLRFPYQDSNRASRAGQRIARRLGIANSR